jgi:hypothetical protein
MNVRRGAAILHTNWPSPSADKEEMEHKRILELALETLQKRRMQVEAEVEALSAEMRRSGRATSKRKAQSTVSAQRKRRARTPAERKAQSKRMKAYWAAKKAAVVAKAKRPAQPGPKDRARSAK